MAVVLRTDRERIEHVLQQNGVLRALSKQESRLSFSTQMKALFETFVIAGVIEIHVGKNRSWTIALSNSPFCFNKEVIAVFKNLCSDLFQLERIDTRPALISNRISSIAPP